MKTSADWARARTRILALVFVFLLLIAVGASAVFHAAQGERSKLLPEGKTMTHFH